MHKLSFGCSGYSKLECPPEFVFGFRCADSFWRSITVRSLLTDWSGKLICCCQFGISMIKFTVRSTCLSAAEMPRIVFLTSWQSRSQGFLVPWALVTLWLWLVRAMCSSKCDPFMQTSFIACLHGWWLLELTRGGSKLHLLQWIFRSDSSWRDQMSSPVGDTHKCCEGLCEQRSRSA